MLTGLVPYDKLDVPDPIAVGIDAIGVKWLAPVMNFGIIFGTLTTPLENKCSGFIHSVAPRN